ncbi:MAG TPA: hypothetical protein ENI86_07585 [Acidimicrobiales bacterium]|nr:hypothetical protein [Acidimicrobiales bacterium]
MEERRTRFAWRRQFRLVVPLALSWAGTLVVLAAAGLQRSVPAAELFLDPSALAGAHWYAGLLSNLGILAWTTAVVSALWGGWVAGRTGRPGAARFLLDGALVTVLMLVDDLLRLHSGVLPSLFGVSKAVAMLMVVAPTVAWAVHFGSEVLRTRWLVLISSLSALAFSVVADRFINRGTATGILLEDGAKLLGVVAFALYFVLTSMDITRSALRAAVGDPGQTVVDSSPDPDPGPDSQGPADDRRVSP